LNIPYRFRILVNHAVDTNFGANFQSYLILW
jgi:hypothetical protein